MSDRRCSQPAPVKAPYVVAMIALESGHRMLSNILDCNPAEVAIGPRVRCRFAETTDPELGLPVLALE